MTCKGGFFMNERALSVLEQYEIDATQIKKGRGGFIIETPKEHYFFTEYQGNIKKLNAIFYIQEKIENQILSDTLVRNKEGNLYSSDKDDITYILKKQPQGRECNYKVEEDIIYAFSHMAQLHVSMKKAYATYLTQPEQPYVFLYKSYITELEKHTKESKHIKKYLIHKKNKTEFEKNLLQNYDFFLEKSYQISESLQRINDAEVQKEITENHMLYHGDFQYHNIIFYKDNVYSTHYEHIGLGSGIKDFCYLFRKINEKNEWNAHTADCMLNTYLKQYTPSNQEWKQLILSLSYPIKFWKIVNYYYNNRKSWISERNLEKLSFIINQENKKEEIIKTLF